MTLTKYHYICIHGIGRCFYEKQLTFKVNILSVHTLSENRTHDLLFKLCYKIANNKLKVNRVRFVFMLTLKLLKHL